MKCAPERDDCPSLRWTRNTKILDSACIAYVFTMCWQDENLMDSRVWNPDVMDDGFI